MNEKELKDILALLEAQGLRAQLCDTTVPVSVSAARCGMPSEMGDEGIEDYVLLPKAVVGMHPEMFVPAAGDSMADAGYEEGDLLRVRFGVTAHDGDNVLAMVDGACTVKTLFTDEEGTRWLVPQNERYDAIRLTEEMDVQVLGVVVGVEKAAVRASSRALLAAIRRTKSKERQALRLKDEAVDRHIATMGNQVRHARQWYAVFRALVDYGVMAEDDTQAFCERVKRLLPEHGHLPVAKELQRMAVQSFSKRVAMWNPSNAPVTGTRFRDYLNIAQMTGRLLGGGSLASNDE